MNLLQRKMSDFVSLPLFGFNSVIKLGKFDFDSHSNTLNFLIKKLYQI